MYMDVQQLGKSLVYIFTYLQYTYCSQNNSLHKYEDNIILWTIYVHLFSISLVLFYLKVLFLFEMTTHLYTSDWVTWPNLLGRRVCV